MHARFNSRLVKSSSESKLTVVYFSNTSTTSITSPAAAASVVTVKDANAMACAVADLAVRRAGLEPANRRDSHEAPPKPLP